MRLPLLSICLIFLFASCENKEITQDIIKNERRILLAYLGGDNSLSNEIDERKNALIVGFQQSLLRDPNDVLLIFADTEDNPTSLTEISTLGIRNSLMMESDNLDASDPSILKLLVNRMCDFYRADSYGLIVFSHGTAWMPEKGMQFPSDGDDSSSPTRGVITDHENEMNLIDFADAVTLPNSKKWDFIIFENCYMGSVEVVYELKDKTKYMLASSAEVLSPGMMPIYGSQLSLLLVDEADLNTFAQAYFDYYNSMNGVMRSATVSVVCTENIDQLATLATEVFDGYLPDEKTLNSWQHFNRNLRHYFFDLEQMMVSADSECRDRLTSILERIVTYKAATPEFASGDYYDFKIENFCGISGYFPQSDFVYLNDYYRRTQWGRKVFY